MHPFRYVNSLDKVTRTPGGYEIKFYATERNKVPTVALLVEAWQAKAWSSRNLPVYNWVDHVWAMQRAREFCENNDIQEAQR